MKIYIGEVKSDNKQKSVKPVGYSRYSVYVADDMIRALKTDGFPSPYIEVRTISVEYDSNKYGAPSNWMRYGKNHRSEGDCDVRDEDNAYWFVDVDETQLMTMLDVLSDATYQRKGQVIVVKHGEFDTLAFGVIGQRWDVNIGLWW